MNNYEKLMWLKAWYNEHRHELSNQQAMLVAIKADSHVRKVIFDLHLALFNKIVSGCIHCYADALIILLTKSTEKKMKEIAECRYKLKHGVLLTDSKGILPDATCANLTDAIAKAYLEDNPARAKFFTFIPTEEPTTEDVAENGAQGEKKSAEVEVPTTEKKTRKRAKKAEK